MDKVALILGAGPNIGEAVARAFTGKGYKVALASRSSNPSDSTDRKLYISSDLSKSGDVLHAFEQTKQTFGIPSVVVYNVSASTLTPPDDPFALALEAFNRDLSVNVTSAFVAAQQAVAGFAQLAEASPKTFIYTGNILNVEIIPGFIDQGMGKAAGAHMVWAASAAYKDRGFKFYYADERKQDGSAKYRVDGDAHAQLFLQLAEDSTPGPWLQTFVKGVGYKRFSPVANLTGLGAV